MEMTRWVIVKRTSRLNGRGSGLSSTSTCVPAASATTPSRTPSTFGDSGIATSATQRSNRRWRICGSAVAVITAAISPLVATRSPGTALASAGSRCTTPSQLAMCSAKPGKRLVVSWLTWASRPSMCNAEQRPGPSMTTAARPSRRSPRSTSTDTSPTRARTRSSNTSTSSAKGATDPAGSGALARSSVAPPRRACNRSCPVVASTSATRRGSTRGKPDTATATPTAPSPGSTSAWIWT